MIEHKRNHLIENILQHLIYVVAQVEKIIDNELFVEAYALCFDNLPLRL